ncbi:hypothetical protein EDC01DRAFT_632634 [Geopyxis carbonaria]|nr:hypothetical protein EDC01DRAFT_632634 [Geopyxis carbonaria]
MARPTSDHFLTEPEGEHLPNLFDFPRAGSIAPSRSLEATPVVYSPGAPESHLEASTPVIYGPSALEKRLEAPPQLVYGPGAPETRLGAPVPEFFSLGVPETRLGASKAEFYSPGVPETRLKAAASEFYSPGATERRQEGSTPVANIATTPQRSLSEATTSVADRSISQGPALAVWPAPLTSTPRVVQVPPPPASTSRESSATPRAIAASVGYSNRRAALQETDRLFLIKLCVEHQIDHRERNIGRFWRKISALLKDSTGIQLRDPSRTVNSWVDARRPVLARQITESGTVQSDTEFTQALDKWIEHVDAVEQLKKDAIKPTAQLDREKEEAAVHRANMFATIANKHYLSDFDTEEEDVTGAVGQDVREFDANEIPVGTNNNSLDGAEDRGTIKSIRRLRKKTRHADKAREQAEQSMTETKMVVSAFGNMGEVMARGMREGLAELATSTNHSHGENNVAVTAAPDTNISTRLETLEQELRKQRRVQEARATENNAVLNRILFMMEQNQSAQPRPSGN